MTAPADWPTELAELRARQATALAEGRAAEAAGRPVIYIHGRPYADPASAPQEAATGP